MAKSGSCKLGFLSIVGMLTSYSYARLSVAYPSQGGTVDFINQAFGEGMVTGSLNVLLWISYVMMLSLYAYAFGVTSPRLRASPPLEPSCGSARPPPQVTFWSSSR